MSPSVSPFCHGTSTLHLLLPLYLMVLAGTFVSIDPAIVMWSILLVLGVPTVLVRPHWQATS